MPWSLDTARHVPAASPFAVAACQTALSSSPLRRPLLTGPHPLVVALRHHRRPKAPPSPDLLISSSPVYPRPRRLFPTTLVRPPAFAFPTSSSSPFLPVTAATAPSMRSGHARGHYAPHSFLPAVVAPATTSALLWGLPPLSAPHDRPAPCRQPRHPRAPSSPVPAHTLPQPAGALPCPLLLAAATACAAALLELVPSPPLVGAAAPTHLPRC
nr:vegetative cell wall protein gp1-like [Aegilops tauschii subsp. strangulata]